MQSYKRKPRGQKSNGRYIRYIRVALVTVLALGAALAFQGLTAPASPGASAFLGPVAQAVLAGSPVPSSSSLPIQGPATVVFEKGEVALGEAAPGGGVAWKPAASGMAVLPGMRIRTFEGYADLLLPGRSMVRIAPHSELVLARMEIFEAGQAVTRLFLSIGRIWVHVIRQLDYLVDFEVQTPSAVAGVRGTIFSVMVAADGSTVVSVHQGKVSVSAGGESKVANRRQEIRSKTGEPMQHPRKLSGEEARAWKEQEEWLKDQEELDKQVEKEEKLHGKGGAGGDTGKNDDGEKESDGEKSGHREESEGKAGGDDGRMKRDDGVGR